MSNEVRGDGYDVIGDIHGYGDHLEALLRKMGYTDNGTSFAHPNRKAAFVGDLVDRGPKQRKTISIVRAMVNSGAAKMVLGNHEISAIGFTIPNPAIAGDFVRSHSDHNRHTHRAFLDQLVEGSADYNETIAWFRSLPIWLDLDGLRIVHACWHQISIDVLTEAVDADSSISNDILVSPPGSPVREALSVLTRGPEVPLPRPYMSETDRIRNKARFAWWANDAQTVGQATMLPRGARLQDGIPYPTDDKTPVDAPIEMYYDPTPVLFGHYWWTGTPQRITPYIGCLDYSVARGGPLVAYRWQGERQLDNDHFVSYFPADPVLGGRR